jgi:hypothetical protein
MRGYRAISDHWKNRKKAIRTIFGQCRRKRVMQMTGKSPSLRPQIIALRKFYGFA